MESARGEEYCSRDRPNVDRTGTLFIRHHNNDVQCMYVYVDLANTLVQCLQITERRVEWSDTVLYCQPALLAEDGLYISGHSTGRDPTLTTLSVNHRHTVLFHMDFRSHVAYKHLHEQSMKQAPPETGANFLTWSPPYPAVP